MKGIKLLIVVAAVVFLGVYVMLKATRNETIADMNVIATQAPSNTPLPTTTPPCMTEGTCPTEIPVPSNTFVPQPTTTATVDVNAFCYQEGRTIWMPGQNQLVWVSNGGKEVTGVDPQVSYNASGEPACAGFRNVCPIPVEQFGMVTPQFGSGDDCPTQTPTPTQTATVTPWVIVVTATLPGK